MTPREKAGENRMTLYDIVVCPDLAIISYLRNTKIDKARSIKTMNRQYRKEEMQVAGKFENENLDRCLRVYIPSRDSQGNKLDNGLMFKEVSSLFVNLCNGCTTYNARGLWKNGNGHIVEEHIVIIEAYTSDRTFGQALNDVQAIVQNYKKDLRQDNIAVFIDNELRLF